MVYDPKNGCVRKVNFPQPQVHNYDPWAMKCRHCDRPWDQRTAPCEKPKAVTAPLTRRTRVYVSGPMLTSGNPYLNVRDGIRAGTTLMKRGYVPFIPHLTAVWEIAAHEEFTYEDWLALDFANIQCCDALLRLPGPSKGADREEAYARELGLTVYYSLDTLFAGLPTEVAWQGRLLP